MSKNFISTILSDDSLIINFNYDDFALHTKKGNDKIFLYRQYINPGRYKGNDPSKYLRTCLARAVEMPFSLSVHSMSVF